MTNSRESLTRWLAGDDGSRAADWILGNIPLSVTVVSNQEIV
jgi:hypothetical protein